jgi:hypothetical protein
MGHHEAPPPATARTRARHGKRTALNPANTALVALTALLVTVSLIVYFAA